MKQKPSCRYAVQLTALYFLSSVFCHAEALPDPTRPPAEISTQTQAVPPKEPGLQSVYISPIRRAAIINGQTVELGERVGNSRLVEVSENGIVLEGAHGRRTMALFPGVELVSRTEATPESGALLKPPAKNSPPAPKAGKPAASEEKR